MEAISRLDTDTGKLCEGVPPVPGHAESYAVDETQYSCLRRGHGSSATNWGTALWPSRCRDDPPSSRSQAAAALSKAFRGSALSGGGRGAGVRGGVRKSWCADPDVAAQRSAINLLRRGGLQRPPGTGLGIIDEIPIAWQRSTRSCNAQRALHHPRQGSQPTIRRFVTDAGVEFIVATRGWHEHSSKDEV